MNHGLEHLADKNSIAYQLYAQHERMMEEIRERERWEEMKQEIISEVLKRV